jgi:hypothetical protein
VKKSLQTTDSMGYSPTIKEISLIGFDSPVMKADAPPQFSVERFFCVHSTPCSLLGRDVRGASCPPVPSFRSVNPHISALFAFDGAEGGSFHRNEGVAL